MHHAGWGRAEIAVEPDGYAMFGYGMWHHRARGKQTPLFARAFCIGDGARRLIFCCADLGSISCAVRATMKSASPYCSSFGRWCGCSASSMAS